MTEWKPVVGWEGRYSVSSDGEVRGVKSGVVLAQQMLKNGRLYVTLSRSGQYKTYAVAGLVAAAFLGPRPEGREVDHVNGDQTDNRVSNMEYVTRSENLLRRSAKGIGSGERHASAKLTADTVLTIREAYAEGMGYKKLAAVFGISRNHARDIALRLTWKHLPA